MKILLVLTVCCAIIYNCESQTTTRSSSTTTTTTKLTTTTTTKPTTTTTTTKPTTIEPSRINWCDPALLGGESQHLGCKNPGKFCPVNCKKARDVVMTDQLKQFILNEHNEYRNLIAGGKLPGKTLPTAANMQTLEWNNNLQYLASLNAKRCDMQHDSKSILIPNYGLVFQNLAVIYKVIPLESWDAPGIMSDRIDSWTAEIEHLKSEGLNLPPGKLDPNRCKYTHLAAVVTDQINQLGCAATQYEDVFNKITFNTTYVVCNYGGEAWREKLYDLGKPTSGCKTGRNSQYTNLCHVNENRL